MNYLTFLSLYPLQRRFKSFFDRLPQFSAGGIYPSPTGILPESRNGSSSTRVISLTPTGASRNHMLVQIIDDNADGAFSGINRFFW